jgi:hypothetical protein
VRKVWSIKGHEYCKKERKEFIEKYNKDLYEPGVKKRLVAYGTGFLHYEILVTIFLFRNL